VLHFAVNDNSISGEIPESTGNWTALDTLNIQTNEWRGKIPDSLENLTNSRDLSPGYNQLTGILPSLQNLPNLTNIYLTSNFLFGPFPQSIANLCCLQVYIPPQFIFRHDTSITFCINSKEIRFIKQFICWIY
jgi:hypothetical protein